MTAPNESKKPLSVSHLGLSDKSSKIESASAESRSYVLPTSKRNKPQPKIER